MPAFRRATATTSGVGVGHATRRRRARVEHAIARLKNWRVLRDHRRRGQHLDDTFRAVCALHNLTIEFRDST
ncbi:MAG: hypothetical protein JNL83_05220 [Myxococcales bacterium]|nr:hypothetical protein [Myxococcales bacterium]